ncbi:MAG: ricin-type beta-trefoil lectin domain protein [Nitrospinae bacterium]|nr:ricin-type beta-trefoil lectin domain protein [Nitrospinota bacterium]
MLRRIGRCVAVTCLSVVFSILAFAPKEAQAAGKDVVFIKAFYPLDEPRFHCIDIPGHRDRVRTTAALVVHTCKEGIWNLDGQFDPAAVGKGMLRMPEYGLCVAAASAADGAKLVLKKCDGTALQDWRFENYRLSLKAHPDKCITIGAEPSRLTRGGRRLPSRHMARSLALAACSEDALERQLWRLEKPMRRTGSIMPFK